MPLAPLPCLRFWVIEFSLLFRCKVALGVFMFPEFNLRCFVVGHLNPSTNRCEKHDVFHETLAYINGIIHKSVPSVMPTLQLSYCIDFCTHTRRYGERGDVVG
jgi:hypothetical protein